MKKRLWYLVLCVLFLSTLVPVTARAASDPGTYTFDVSEGSITIGAGTDSGTLKVTYGASSTKSDNIAGTQVITFIGTTTANTVTVASGVTANLTLSGVDISLPSTGGCAFELQGASAVNLTLTGTNSLVSGADYAGLQVPENAMLTIDGTGSLSAASSYVSTLGTQGAGIGGGKNGASGTITINGGDVAATSWFGAGIGGGSGGDGGTVTITGGTVSASGNMGAGIGGGVNGGDGGTVTIHGGTVTATGSNGAGIGGGDGGDGGTVTIHGGTVTATGSDGAGIGSGYFGGDAGTVTIHAGIVSATSHNGAGIGGSGNGFNIGCDGGIVTINGGTVTATSVFGAGIGGGRASGLGGTVIINGGSVMANGGVSAHDIGAGLTFNDKGTLKNGSGDDVYITTVTLEGVASATAIHSLTTSGTYGINGMQTDTGGKLYLYLPVTTHTTAAQATDGGSPATIRDYAGDIETTAAGGSGMLLLTTGSNTQHTGNTQNSNSHTLTNNATGLTVSGPGIRAGTTLIIQPLSLDEPGQSPGSDAIRQYILDNDLTVLFGADLSLSRSFSGGLTLTIPVGTEYDGQTLTLLHYHDGVLKTLTAVVVNGQAAFTLSGLSPVVLVADTAALSSAADATKTLDNIPVTGDSSSTVWWLLCGLSTAGIAVLLGLRKRAPGRQ